MDITTLTLEEMRYIYAAKCDELESLIDGYWSGSVADIENETTLKDQIRALGADIQELERVIAARKSALTNQPNSTN